MKTVPGAVDVTIPQVLHYPAIFIKTDRDNALAVGVTQNDIATNLLVTLASSSLVAPNYWVNPKNTVNYIVAVQTPTREIASMAAIDHIPIRPSQSSLAALMAAMTTPLPAPTTQYLSNIAHVRIGTTPGSITHYTVQRVVDVLVNTEGRSLGAVYGGIRSALKSFSVPPGTILRFRGQSAEMFDSFRHFGLGLLLAALLVYLLLVMNFQSFLDPFIILMSVPAGLSGVALALFATHTTLNVESAMGAIMVVGVATANS
ncbi:acriflavin resistance protein, partial [mine drainage metagenome]